MATRPIFVSTDNARKYVNEIEIEFKWFPGISKSQKQKSIDSLHFNANKKKAKLGFTNILEISSKSKNQLGVNLSAFNLSFISKENKSISVECLFQGSKVFEKGGPYTEIYNLSSREAKKYEKLKKSGNLLYFKRKNEIWGLEPKTLFYDWIYINTLKSNPNLIEKLVKYDAFTDIEFNPKKSINCQASSVALFVSLYKNKQLHVLESKDIFTDFMKKQKNKNSNKLF